MFTKYKLLVARLCATVLASLFAVAASAQTRPLALQDLTLPPTSISRPCGISPFPTVTEGPSADGKGVRVHMGLWASLPITTNPWIGTDSHVLAEIRSRIDPPRPLLDAPRSTSEAARFRLALADGVEEGYSAVYSAGGDNPPVVVYALRFAEGRMPFSLETPSTSSTASRFVFGPSVVVTSGNRGPCFELVEAHVKSLMK